MSIVCPDKVIQIGLIEKLIPVIVIAHARDAKKRPTAYETEHHAVGVEPSCRFSLKILIQKHEDRQRENNWIDFKMHSQSISTLQSAWATPRYKTNVHDSGRDDLFFVEQIQTPEHQKSDDRVCISSR